MLKVVILDDDKVSREIIRSYINFTDFLEFEAEFDNPLVALKEIGNIDVDLLLLSILCSETT